MSTHEKQGEKTESHHDSHVAKPEHAGKEAAQHMSELVKDRKQFAEFLKAGGKSGISHDFGKPTFVDSARDKGNAEKQGRPETSADAGSAAVKDTPAQKTDNTASTYKTGEPLSMKDFDQMASALSDAKTSASDAKVSPSDAKPADDTAGASLEKSGLLLEATVTRIVGGSNYSLFKQIKGIEHCTGTVQIGKEHYQVDDGKLYHETADGHRSGAPLGELMEGGKINFSDGRMGDLNKQDCLVKLKDQNGEHDILSAGGRQLDLGVMKRDAQDQADNVQEAQQRYHEHKPFTSDFANALSKQLGGMSLDQCVDQSTDNFNQAKKQFDQMHDDLMNGKVSGDDIAKMARTMSATSTAMEDLAYDQNDAITSTNEAQKVAKDFVIDSGATVATAGMGAGLQAAFRSSEVATTLNAAMKAREALVAEQTVQEISQGGKLAINVAKGTIQGGANVGKEYKEGETTGGDAMMAFGSGMVGEVLPGHVADKAKEGIFGSAMEEAMHSAKKAAEQSNAALRTIARSEAEKGVGVLSAAGKVTEKTVEEGTKKVTEETMKSDQARNEEEAKKAIEEEDKGSEPGGESNNQEKSEDNTKSTQESAEESVPVVPPVNAEKADGQASEKTANEAQEEE